MDDYADPFDLTGRRVLVTGASRGIGFAAARALARRGAAVAITARKADGLAAAATQLRAGGADVLPVACHQGDASSIAHLFEQLEAAGFSADAAVINAATNPVFGPLLDLDLDAWRKILDVNLTGAMLTAREAARRMLPRQRGSLIFMASLAGIDPFAGLGAYGVSKAGLLGLMRRAGQGAGAGRGARQCNRAGPGGNAHSRRPCSPTDRPMTRSSRGRRWAGTASRRT